MKKIILCAILVAFCIGQTFAETQSPLAIYQQALVQERGAGNLKQAIQLFERAAKDAAGDRSLAANALIGAARSYEKLGQIRESRTLYAEVARSYSEQGPQAAIAREHLAETGIVQGTVTRAGSSDPIPDAKVSLGGGPLDAASFKMLQDFFRSRNGVEIPHLVSGVMDEKYFQDLADVASAKGVSLANPTVRAFLDSFQTSLDSRFTGATDSEGHFTIRNVPSGRYTARAEHDGFFPTASDLLPTNVASVTGGQTNTVDVSLVRGATISGRVTDAAGQPQPNVTVRAFSIVYQAGFPVLQPSVTKTTNDEGDYRLFWLGSGEYLVAVVPDNTPPPPPPIPTPILINLGNGPLPATANANAVQAPSYVRTFYPGTVDVSSAVPVIVRGEGPISGIDIHMRKVSTFHIKGEIHSHVPPPPAAAAPGATALLPDSFTGYVGMRPRNINVPDGPANPQRPVTMKRMGSEYVGQFDITNILPGAYHMFAWVYEPSPDGGAALAFSNMDVDVNSNDVAGIAFDIYPTVRLNGTVTVDGRAPGAAAARVWLQGDGPLGKAGVYKGLAARAVVASKDTGEFMIPAVLAGNFHLMLGAGLPPELYVADVRQAGKSVFDSGFEVGKDSPSPIQVMLNSGARTVDGVVRNANGKPAANVTAVLVPPMEKRQNHALYYTAKTDVNGRFKVTGVAPGYYSLFSWQNMPDGAYYNDRFVSRNEDAGRKISTVSSSVSNADITLIPSIGQ